MKKTIALGVAILALAVVATGLTLIFSSFTIAQNTADKELHTVGQMDTIRYEHIITHTTSNVRTGCTIISLLGGAGFLLAASALYKEFVQG